MKTKIANNAILKFGMKMKMRAKSSLVLMLIVTIVSLLILVITLVTENYSSYYEPDYSGTAVVLFYVISIMHCVFMGVITPATAGSSISSERERQTIDVLLCTQMSPKNIVIGKYLSSVSWLILISFSLLPSYFVIMMMGGVSALTVIVSFAFIIWISLVCAALAVYISSVIKRSAGAIVVSLVTVIGIEVAGLLLAGIHSIIVDFATRLGYYGYYTYMMSPSFFVNPAIVFVLIETALIYGPSAVGNVLFSCEPFELYIAIALTIVLYTAIAILLLKKAIKKVDPMREKLSKKDKKLRKEYEKNEELN